MPIRQLNENDLDRMTLIAQRGMEFDEINEALVREKTLGAKDYDSALGLGFEEDGQLVAFAQGALGKGEKGAGKSYVRILVVDRAHRTKGIGSAILNEIEVRLKAKGALAVSMLDCPQNYHMPGIDFRYTEAYCFMLSHNYEMFRENHNLICDLDTKAWPELDQQIESLSQDGIFIRRARQEDRADLFEFLDANWPAWKEEAEGALENDPVSLYIGHHEGKVIAFSGYQGNNKSLNWFGPMGTLPVLRGKGIGSVVLRLCLRDLARQGWKTAIIPWVGPVRFYARFCGARFDRCFWAWKKQL